MADATIQLDPSQRVAVDLMCEASVGAVTGGGGVGKTTCLRLALDRLDAKGQRYELASPTGKAARRMKEATGREAQTVHRLLRYGLGPTGGFLHGADYPLECDAVFVDEASMLDTELAAALFAAVQAPTRLIFIGDANQLPSVGPGTVFADLIESGTLPVARLTKLHRSAAESWVATQAPRILAGEMPDLSPRHDFQWVEVEHRDACVRGVVHHAMERGADGNPAQVLVAQNRGVAGTVVLNTYLKQRANPGDGRGVKLGPTLAHPGDRVIQTRNDYDLGVMNGELGELLASPKRGIVRVRFEGSGVHELDEHQAASLQHAWALTPFRFQGSQCPWVVVMLHSCHSKMNTRALLYTSVTRAQEGVVLVGDRKGLLEALRNTSDRRRNTGLVGRLREVVA